MRWLADYARRVRLLPRAVIALDFALVLGGVVAIIWGVHFWSAPAAWVVGGVIAVVLGVLPPLGRR